LFIYCKISLMTNSEKITFKNKLKNLGLDVLKQRIARAQAAMDQAQEAANSEEKSSAGDKYETGRAMGQLQKEMHGRQLAEYAKEVKALQSLIVDPLSDSGGPGAFVQAAGIAFFVSAGLGRQEVEGSTILFVSPLAPLARALQSKKAGDSLLFNGVAMAIECVY
jgi:transcription elongation GreA/GreB family factor